MHIKKNSTQQLQVFSIPILKPLRRLLNGSYVIIEKLNINTHAEALFSLVQRVEQEAVLTFLPHDAFLTFENFKHWLQKLLISDEIQFYTLLDLRTHLPIGFLSYKNITSDDHVIVCEHTFFSADYINSQPFTEAIFLLLQHFFTDLGYQQYVWQAHIDDKKSAQQARALAFKEASNLNENDDSLAFVLNSQQWIWLKEKFIKWLDPANFDHHGQQIFTFLEI